jgi:hypothetical protein
VRDAATATETSQKFDRESRRSPVRRHRPVGAITR